MEQQPNNTIGFNAFLIALGLFGIGLALFNELYALYLVGLGVTPQTIGKIATATSIGTVLGTLPAGLLVRRFGIAKIVVLTIGIAALLAGVRSFAFSSWMAYATAGLSGFLLGLLMVAATLAVTSLTTESRRAWGFSMFFGVSIGAAVIGDALGGEVHQWAAWFHKGTPTEEKRLALRVACGISLLGVIPALLLKLPSPTEVTRILFPRNRMILRMFIAIAFWNFAFGLFLPFYTVYFQEELAASVRQIGVDLTGGQIASAIAILSLPKLVQRFKPRGIGIVLMLGAAIACFYLWLDPDQIGTAAGFALLNGCIGMTQPLLLSMVMNSVKMEERTGTAILSALIGFLAAAISAYIGGWGISVKGFGEVLFASGIACVLSAIVFSICIRMKTDMPVGK